MDSDDDEQNKNSKREKSENSFLQRFRIDVGTVLQSIWIRCRSIFPNSTDGKFMESELRFVLYSGVLFWTVYLLYQISK